MRKIIAPAALVCLTLTAPALAEDGPEAKPQKKQPAPQSVLEIEVENIEGETIKLETYRGKVLLIVNVASRCGLTDRNYKQLEPLFRKYKDKGLRILAFPANDFGAQEPGTEAEASMIKVPPPQSNSNSAGALA